ncbi:hypothetical protein O181_045957 [Austropuccinia psidii MF-1]|uniref:Gag-Pol-p199 n=1 Tax=Austropuccinia psidii MF-1 TaxID=1389203 RepID=A0A9Q3DQB9_9BASI|nr:hypothetical protein [Austropuccinia psidii MF-1]
MVESIDPSVNDMTVIMQADKQAEIFQRFISLAEKIRPQLRDDGANFNLWSKNMITAWTTYFMGDPDYFHQSNVDTNIKRNLVARLFIEHSVSSNAYESVTSRIFESDARRIYQALKDWFNRPSWSSIIYHANVIFKPSLDHSNSINNHAMAITEAVHNLENQLGQIDSEIITTLAIYFAVPSMHQLIMPALNTLMATNPNIKVRPEDLLNMIRQIATASPSFDHSTEIARINASSKFGKKESYNNHHSHVQNKFNNRPNVSSSSNHQATSRVPSSRFPCHYCGEVGHWSPNCPVKARANEARTKARHQKANVAGIGVVPTLEAGEALIDSGATHSVVGNPLLFTSLTSTNMTLSVASSESFKVNAIGTIILYTPCGLLRLNNVLYCPHISGVILSLGHLLKEHFSVLFSNDLFTISTPTIRINTIKRNDQWFIPFHLSSKNGISTNSLLSNISSVISADESLGDSSVLWHRRIGHLSIRQLKRMQKLNAAINIPNISFRDIRLCHDCSLSKSQHNPVKTISRDLINKPGDLIVADLMGPYVPSLNHKKYILMIQDVFSRVVVAIPLSDKTEAKAYLINWIKQFLNVTTYRIKTVRTDNGTEFKNTFFNEFLTQHGILHEYSMPYEHHQNGQIERTNRTISEMARTSLLAARLPPILWPWAFRHSVWIFNRSLHVNADKTPFEILGKKRPDMSLLRVFGAKSFIYNHNFRKDFSPRALIGYHVGVSEDSKGWLFWIPGKKEIVKLASVKFDEFNFYANKPSTNVVESIQVRDIFDGSMVEELKHQDASIVDSCNRSGLQISIPATYDEAITSHNKNDWIQAINEEIDSMKTEDVFTLVTLKVALCEVPHESILGTRWIFTKKPERFKARLVARGFHQIHGINYDETFAPTPTFSSLRLLLSTACLKKWIVRTFDVKVAFLHSLIDKPVYIWPPKGMDVPKYSVLKLNKALYGTKQASRCWWFHLREILQRIGFKNNEEDSSTYTLNEGNDQAILWVHVDDGALTASSPQLLDRISRQLNAFLKIKWDKLLNGLVGISMQETEEGFKLWQPELIDKLTNLTPSKIVAKTPLPANCQLESSISVGNMDKPFLKRIGILLYIAQACRPDISFAVNYLARFSLCTNQSHWHALEHLIAYLCGTRDVGILIRKSNISSEMKVFVDANWGGEGSRSTHGYIVMHAKEILWMYNLFMPLLNNPIPILLSDNRTAVGISTESMNRKQTRHLIREFNTINEFIVTNKLRLEWVSTNEQLADILTKPLGFVKNAYFVSKINSS